MYQVTERIISRKGHTIGFVAGQQEWTRNQAVKLARRGQLRGVKVINSMYGPYLMGKYSNLYDLPTRPGCPSRFANKRSK